MFSCESPKYDLSLENNNPVFGTQDWESAINQENILFIFLSPDCPLCQNYAKAIRELHLDYGDEINFVGLVSGELYSEKEITEFMHIYKLNFPVFLDATYNLSESFDAEITPEVVFYNTNTVEVLYQGAIDNWAISLGKKRTVVTEKYLKEAFENYFANKEINPNKTEAVGCFIQ